MIETTPNLNPNSRLGGNRFDILKFVLALMIVALHSRLYPRALLPIVRLAVPLFFMMTSYFFNIKLIGINDENKKRQKLLNYLKRNGQLYLFWSVTLLPFVILFHLAWFRSGFGYAIIQILKSIFITGFFTVSWFILAAVYSVVLVFLMSKRLSNGWILIISFLVYVLALLDSNYGGLLSEEARVFLKSPNIRYSMNLPAAMIWVVLGKILAEKSSATSPKLLYPLLAGSFILYYLEFYLLEHYGWHLSTDCFLLSIPLCYLIFTAIIQSKDVDCKHALWLRKSSIIIYCLHYTVILIIRLLQDQFNLSIPDFMVFTITLAICLGFAWGIIYCSEVKKIRLLRYAY